MTTTPQVRFFKDRDGRDIAYALHGQGPLVICPAWWISHVEKDWEHMEFRRFFEGLAQGLTIVRYDRPGVGLSGSADSVRTLDAEADLLLDLANELRARQYSLLAMSCGSPPAIMHAARHPDRVTKICFCGAYVQGPAICPLDVQQAMLATVRAHWGLGSRAMADVFMPDADRDQIRDFARYQRDAAEMGVAAELLELTYAMDARPYLDRIFAETLVIHRRKDRAIPLAAGREVATGIRGARLVTLPGSNHMPWMDDDDVMRTARAFFLDEDVGADMATTGTGTDSGNGAGNAAEAPGTEVALDRDRRCVVLDGEDVRLTPLEFGVLSMLVDAEGAVVTRDMLLESVWQQPFEGSNKVDVLVRALRRKLGPYAASVETVIGHGFRFAGWQRA